MADKKTKKDESPEGDEAKGGGKKKLLIVGLVAVLALAGAAYFFLFASSGEAEAAPEPEHGGYTALEPIAVNLAGGGYLKIGITLDVTVEGAAGGGHGGGDVPERNRVAEGGVDDEVLDRAAGLADQVRVRPGVAAVVAVALADAELEHLADALEHVDRLVDRGEAGGGVIDAHAGVDLLDGRVAGVVGQHAQHGHPLRRQAEAVAPQAREELAIPSGRHRHRQPYRSLPQAFRALR